LVGIQGTIRFDPTGLRYLGQPEPSRPFTIVNHAEAARGVLRLATLDLGGIDGSAGVLVFRVHDPAAIHSIRYQFGEGALLDLQRVGTATVGSQLQVADWALSLPATPRLLSLEDWAAWVGSPLSHHAPMAVPGAGLIYGDAHLDGVLRVVDAFAAANQAVGNFPLIIDPTKDYVVAANVVPFNLPGLGEAGDPAPPGVEVSGLRVVSIGDAAAIGNEAVGNDQPVVGELIPGRMLAATRVVVTGDVAADRTFTRDTIYELQGLVRIDNGSTLTIEPGTRIEGDPATRGALMVRRGGVLLAVGTFLEPIVFTCKAMVPAPGCWGGVVINGFSLLNNDQSGGGGIPACPEKLSIGSNDLYGGCLTGHSSGTLRYVRIEHAGMPVPGGTAVPSLALLGPGSGTTIDLVQVVDGLGDGVFISGGTVNLRHLVVTANGGTGLRWDDGWVGKAQFLIVQQRANAGAALLGSNWGTNPNATPRSNPVIYHAVLIGNNNDATPGAAIRLVAGTAMSLRSSIVLGFSGPGLDIDDGATCALIPGGVPTINLESTFFFGNSPAFDPDVDCVDEEAYGLAPGRANQLIDPTLVAPANPTTIDVRPAPGSPAATGGALAPGDGFFDPVAAFFGAVEAIGVAGGNVVPWFTGWTRGWTP
jgi:hypothetical protein